MSGSGSTALTGKAGDTVAVAAGPLAVLRTAITDGILAGWGDLEAKHAKKNKAKQLPINNKKIYSPLVAEALGYVAGRFL